MGDENWREGGYIRGFVETISYELRNEWIALSNAMDYIEK
jgi:hypothetical protein